MSLVEGYNSQEISLLKHLAKQELARRKYIDYLEYIYPNYTRTNFNEHIAMKIDQLVIDGGKRYMFFLPPRHGKSYTITKSLPAYFLMKNPDKEVMLTSYGADLSADFGKANRDIFKAFAPDLSGHFINDKKQGVLSWEVKDHDGVCHATSIKSAATGKGADLLIIDDPIKNLDDVNTIEKRDALYEHYLSTFHTRLQGEKASIVVILTRWHEDDLAGRILAETERQKMLGDKYEDWEVISFPAIAEEKDILGRKPGEALWPKKYSVDDLALIKSISGSKTWNSLYQQSPIIDDGEVFHRADFQRYNDLPKEFDIILQSWDTTFKNTLNSDYVVGQVWGKVGSKFYMIHQIRGRYSFTETKRKILLMKEIYPHARGILIEESSNGHAIINELSETISGIIPITVRDSKESRAQAVTPYFEAHNVYVPNDSTGDDIINESCKFPNGTHDDQVDSMTQALNYFRDHDMRIQTFNKSVLGLR